MTLSDRLVDVPKLVEVPITLPAVVTKPPKPQCMPGIFQRSVTDVSYPQVGFCERLTNISFSHVSGSLLMTGLVIGGLFLLVSNPVGWLVAAVGITAFALSVLSFATYDKIKGRQLGQTFGFEVMALWRHLRGTNYNAITGITTSGENKLYLGEIPNAGSNDLASLEELGIRHVVTLLQDEYETAPLGLSRPYTQEEYGDRDIGYNLINAKDHKLIGPKELDDAADAIALGLSKGSVYVHCRAGVGRSATAIAAYLIKHKDMSIEEACRTIMRSRKTSILNKIPALVNFAKYLEMPVSDDMLVIANAHSIGTSKAELRERARCVIEPGYQEKVAALRANVISDVCES